MLFCGCGSGSCNKIAKLCVPAGAFIQSIFGETPEGALLQEYFMGSSAPSFRSGIMIMNGGGAAFLAWAKTPAAPASNRVLSKNILILEYSSFEIVLFEPL